MDAVSRRYRKLKVCAEKCLSNEGREKKNPLNVSATKLEVLPFTSASTSNAIEENYYVIMNNSMWSLLLSNTKCDECNMCSLDVTSNGSYGFSSKIELKCKNREKEKQSYKEDILQVSRKIIRQEHNELASPSDQNNEIIDITVSYDGTWQKRGHRSLYGIGIVVDILTGLVIDYEILSKYCPVYTTAKRDLEEHSADFSIWYKAHKPECSENYVGSSNAMEVKASEIFWTRSVENCGM
ncbi:hypothetical protein AVEN_71656-1 [Araneus ventricosus]|uniref:Mutator-like transposase domain-containing protein n=1 Tax=Araneus ventricosus TaxID=182803 RepID=A0A4Y2KV61_ARAVE|nr:hypothetical protein AVEN_71656-1 [Araneus ventricosus]